MKYRIVAAEKREAKNGKPYFTMTLGDEATGTDIDRVGVFDNLESIKVGSEIEGSIIENAAGYKNFRFPRQAGVKSQGGSRGAQMEQVMNRKREDISQAMDKKQDAIRMSGAMRDATLLLVAELSAMTARGEDIPESDVMKDIWKGWRDYFINTWDEPVSEPFNSNGK